MKRSITAFLFLSGIISLGLVSCQKGNLLSNPNSASTTTTVPTSLLLNTITNEMYNGGGVLDGVGGAQNEGPWNQVMRWNQYFVSSYPYYWGDNTYTWTNTATQYPMLKYVNLMVQQAESQYGTTPNVYVALAKFFEAYSFIWYTQRVGDIPMIEAGNPTLYPQPKYDLQHDVYKNCLALLDTANTLMGALAAVPANTNALVDPVGDIFGMTYLQWQKVINTYKLRVLISLSRRSTDNADLNIPTQFANIVNNPSTYPIMTGNSDNLAYHYLSSPSRDNYPLFPNYTPYVGYENMGNTFINVTAANNDPRTFIAATPAPAQIAGGKQISDFTAYVGADIGLSYSQITVNNSAGMYSYNNYLRYYGTASGPNVSGATCEPYIVIGYPEMCFNIAEAANLGWISGVSGSSWYTNGIKADMSWLGLSDGATVTVGLPIFQPTNFSNVLGTVTVSVTNFMNQTQIAYAGDNPTGLNQILTQKYVAFWQNSGWEAYYNWRRTGVPTFSQGGAGIGTPNLQIPIRWQYPVDEQTSNTANYSASIQSQFGGSDVTTATMWLTK
jgi:hypothetical protein